MALVSEVVSSLTHPLAECSNTQSKQLDAANSRGCEQAQVLRVELEARNSPLHTIDSAEYIHALGLFDAALAKIEHLDDSVVGSNHESLLVRTHHDRRDLVLAKTLGGHLLTIHAHVVLGDHARLTIASVELVTSRVHGHQIPALAILVLHHQAMAGRHQGIIDIDAFFLEADPSNDGVPVDDLGVGQSVL